MRIISANLNGIRSAATKGFFDWLPTQRADVVCVQELKAQAADLKTELIQCDGLTGAFHYAEKKGYSGVGVYTRKSPQRIVEGLGVPEFDAEGRYIEADYGNLAVISLYQPSGSSGDERQQAKFRFMDVFFPHLQALIKSGREIVICGDWNIAHKEADLKNWKSNQKNSGFLPEERAWIDEVVGAGYIDSFRHLHPHTKDAYTYWDMKTGARARNVGWRIDYFFISPDLLPRVKRATMMTDFSGSDHCPIVLELK